MKPSSPHRDQALRGRVVVITRAADQSRTLSQELANRGATVWQFPVVEFVEPADWTPLKRALANLPSYDWVIFTSQNAVRFFFAAVSQQQLKPSFAPRVAVVGPETQRALADLEIAAALCPEKFSSAALFESLSGQVAGKKILLPQSDRASPALGEQLRQAGAEVDAVVAYCTLRPKAPDRNLLHRIRSGDVDAVIFASPSAVDHFVELVGRPWLTEFAGRICWVSMGPSTTKALGEFGVSVIEAEEATSTGLARALAEYFLSQPQPLATGREKEKR